MSYNIISTNRFEKELKRLQKEHMHQKKMEAAIASQKHGNPLGPPVASK